MSESCEIYEFGRYRLDPAHRSLIGEDGPVALSSRAFDILALLVENRHRVVTKDEIMSRVWRGTIVEENNLAVQISALRRALNDRADGAPLIVTVAGQGYRFVGRIKPPVDPAPAPAVLSPALTALPASPALDPALAPAVPARPVPLLARRFGWVLPAIVAAFAAAVFTGRWADQRRPAPLPVAAPAPPRLSLAVLPFRNLGDDEKDNYLADAVSDDVTTDLSHIPGSVVIARESSDIYRGRNVPTEQIGRELNVRYLLEGSLRRAEDGFSINAQLFEAATGAHVWAERFKVPRDHIAETQETIVRRLASALGVTLVDAEGLRSLHEHAGNPDALDLFLRARSMLDRSDTLSSMTQAQQLLEQAIAIQPDYADALSELGWLLMRKVRSFDEPHDADDRTEARRIIPLALSLSPNAPQALAAQGLLAAADEKCETARASYEAALSFDTNNVAARTGLIQCLSYLGHFDEAVQRTQELLRIDPEGPRNKNRYNWLGFFYLMLGRPADALVWLNRAESGDPEPKPGADDLGRVEYGKLQQIAAIAMLGDVARARAQMAEYAAIWPNRTVWHIAAELTHAQAVLPNFQRFMDAIAAAGMPRFADEHADAGVAPQAVPAAHREFDPTPLHAPGIPTIDTAGMVDLLKTGKPLIVDMGRGAAAVPGARMADFDDLSRNEALRFKTTLPGDALTSKIVVMGNGPYGWQSYNAALQLRDAGLPGVTWYRGGEEAWAAAGLKSVDVRSP